MLLKAIKRAWWDLRDPIGRFNYLNAILRHLPGEAGMMLRARFITPHFGAAGERIIIHEGVRYRSVHRIQCGSDVELGVDCFLQASGGLKLGDRVLIGPGVKIWTINHRFDDPERPIAEQDYDERAVEIGADCWLGANVFVMPGVQLAHGCVVSAGSVVGIKNWPAYSIIAGNPARVIGNRRQSSQPEPEPREVGSLSP